YSCLTRFRLLCFRLVFFCSLRLWFYHIIAGYINFLLFFRMCQTATHFRVLHRTFLTMKATKTTFYFLLLHRSHSSFTSFSFSGLYYVSNSQFLSCTAWHILDNTENAT
ncbi:unnamed protein product, partial [Pylaiella littoralis]